MYKTIFKYLERTALKYSEKIAFSDSNSTKSYGDFLNQSKHVATEILKYNLYNCPIAIFLDKNVNCLVSMMGINYSGNYYTVIDNKMPIDRVKKIIQTLDPKLIISDTKNISKLNELGLQDIINVDTIDNEINQEQLDIIYNNIIDTNPMYILFTSGSTGIPKGTVLTHKSVIAYIDWYVSTFKINSRTVFGSQTPFYFSMSVSDVFATMVSGATLHIIPKMLFSFPVKLIDYLNEKKINTIYWVPSALSIVANFKTFNYATPKYLKNILFAGEVMPTKNLNYWIKKLPKAMYANLFGPTETVDICSYYIVDRKFADDEVLPIGKKCDNCDLFVINDSNKEAAVNEQGELYVRGSFLSPGYYNNPDKTKEMFVQNPLNNNYPEIVYKTGDIVRYNQNGELEYISRRDFQIKHMGYRIELGEIECAINSIEDINISVCIYDFDKSNIVLFYQSNTLEEKVVLDLVKKKVPNYMVPQKIIRLQQIPYNSNGKIDRKLLSEDYKKGKYENE